MDSCIDMEACTIEMAGVLRGYGLHLMEESRACLTDCRCVALLHTSRSTPLHLSSLTEA
jgi:hypothetical protein